MQHRTLGGALVLACARLLRGQTSSACTSVRRPRVVAVSVSGAERGSCRTDVAHTHRGSVRHTRQLTSSPPPLGWQARHAPCCSNCFISRSVSTSSVAATLLGASERALAALASECDAALLMALELTAARCAYASAQYQRSQLPQQRTPP